MEHKAARQKELPTLALRLKPYKAATQQLRSILRGLKEATTVTFLPTPAMILQTVRAHYISKIIFNSSCLYVTDRRFSPKTINNVLPILGNFSYITSSKELTQLYIEDTSGLETKIHMAAPDFTMDLVSACIHGQDIIRESGECSSRVDLEYSAVCDLIKWLTPHTRVKRNVKRQPVATGAVHVIVHASPPTIKFVLGNNSELEFTANTHVGFHEVKNMRIGLQAKNFHQALLACAVTKLACTIRILADHDVMLFVGSKTSAFSVENFLTEEQQYIRNDVSCFDRPSGGHRQSSSANGGAEGPMGESGNDLGNDDPRAEPPPKKHDRSSGRKGGGGDPDHVGARDRYEQHKITSYMTAKTANVGGDRDRGYFGDSKEESDSDESVNFDFVHSAKKQKC